LAARALQQCLSGAAPIVVLLSGLCACSSDDDPIVIIQRSGGDTTTLIRSGGTFETVSPNLTLAHRTTHLIGDSAFEAIFEAPPATVNAGLGPQFNHVSCASCHVRNGRGTPTANHDDRGSSLLVRVSQPGVDPVTGGPVGLPRLGDQLQDHAIYGVTPEVHIAIEWETLGGKYDDGEAYQLRRPTFQINLGDGTPLANDVLFSPRIPPPVFGLGLLEAIPESDILALADPNDSDGDGISGRPNFAYNAATHQRQLGRFGWKANTPNLRQQAAAAYFADMGVSNPLFPESDASSDIDEAVLSATEFYTQTLAVPARASLNAESRRGAQLFFDAACASCHRTSVVTGSHAIEEICDQLIAPYSDLLLHDLGEELADHRPDFDASGSEWRTAPLWGIGLTESVLGEGAFLHDGRARTLEEAILWHGGEATNAKRAFMAMRKVDRAALVAFLRSL
jgi:CxxC motif-containing protein (DUF1111 family)